MLSADNSVKSRVSYGGTAPKNVRREANKWLKTAGAGAGVSVRPVALWGDSVTE